MLLFGVVKKSVFVGFTLISFVRNYFLLLKDVINNHKLILRYAEEKTF